MGLQVGFFVFAAVLLLGIVHADEHDGMVNSPFKGLEFEHIESGDQTAGEIGLGIRKRLANVLAPYHDETYKDNRVKKFGKLLKEKHFDHATVTKMLGTTYFDGSLSNNMTLAAAITKKLPDNAAGDLVRFLCFRVPMSDQKLIKYFGIDGVKLLSNLVLVAPIDQQTFFFLGQCTPFANGLIICSDHLNTITNGDFVHAKSPTADEKALMRATPHRKINTLLSIQAGSGLQAIHAAKFFAKKVTAVEINPRAIRYIRFNAALNGISSKRMKIIQADGYDALEDDERFDAIVGSIPSIPTPEGREDLVESGGPDGEDEIIRTVGQAEEILTEDGMLIATFKVMNPSQEYEDKLKNWWPASSPARMFFYTGDLSEHSVISRAYGQSKEERRSWRSHLEKIGVTTFTNGILYAFPAANDIQETEIQTTFDLKPQLFFLDEVLPHPIEKEFKKFPLGDKSSKKTEEDGDKEEL